MARKAGAGRALFFITGDREIDLKLKRLERRVQRKLIRKAMRDGMKLVQATTRANAPVESGATKKAIKVRSLKRSRRSFGIEVRVGKGDYKGDQYYAAFPEFGTKGPRGQPAQHWMESAFKQVGDTARNITLRSLKTGIEQTLRGS